MATTNKVLNSMLNERAVKHFGKLAVKKLKAKGIMLTATTTIPDPSSAWPYGTQDGFQLSDNPNIFRTRLEVLQLANHPVGWRA